MPCHPLVGCGLWAVGSILVAGWELEMHRTSKHSDLNRSTLYRNGHFEASTGIPWGRSSKHNDLKRTTLYRNGHFEARKWGGALEAPWEGGFGSVQGAEKADSFERERD